MFIISVLHLLLIIIILSLTSSSSNINDRYKRYYEKIVQILYNKNLAFHLLHGITVHPITKDVIWLLEPCTNEIHNCNFFLPNIVTLLSIQSNLNCYNRGLAFSLDPWSKSNPWGSQFRKVYYPISCSNTLRESLIGVIMFNMDWDLKMLISKHSFINTSTNISKTIDELLYSIPTSNSNNSSNSTNQASNTMVRVWMSVKDLEVSYSDDHHSIFFGKVSFVIKACSLFINASTHSGLSEHKYLPKAYQELLNILNDNIHDYHELLPSLKQLEQLVIANSAIRFIQSRLGILSNSYLNSIDYRILDNSIKVPSIISESNIYASTIGIVSIDRFSNIIYQPKQPSDIPLKILGLVPFEEDTSTGNKTMVKVSYECILSSNTNDVEIDITEIITTMNNTMNCNLIDHSYSFDEITKIEINISSNHDNSTICTDALGVKLHINQKSYLFLESKIVNFQYNSARFIPTFITDYSVLGTLVYVHWNYVKHQKQLHIHTDDSDSLDRRLKDSIALVAITAKDIDSNNILYDLLLLLQNNYSIAGVILGWNDKHVASIPDELTIQININNNSISHDEYDYNNSIIIVPTRLVPKSTFEELVAYLVEANEKRTEQKLEEDDNYESYHNRDSNKNNNNNNNNNTLFHQLNDVRVSLACGLPRKYDQVQDEFNDDINSRIYNITVGDSTYFTLDLAPMDGIISGCQRVYLPLPPNVELVPPHPQILDEIVATHTWSTDVVLLSDFVLYGTLQAQDLAGEMVQAGNLEAKQQSSDSSMENVFHIRPANCKSRILVRTISREVYQSGYFYQTLDYSSVEGLMNNSNLSTSCQSIALPLPISPYINSPWEIAPPTQEVIRYVVQPYSWETLELILSDGISYKTKHNNQNDDNEHIIDNNSMRNNEMKMILLTDMISNQIFYQPISCEYKILIRRQFILENENEEKNLNFIEKKEITRKYYMDITLLPPITSEQYLIELSSIRYTLTTGGIDLTNISTTIHDNNNSSRLLYNEIADNLKYIFSNDNDSTRSTTTIIYLKDSSTGKQYEAYRAIG